MTIEAIRPNKKLLGDDTIPQIILDGVKWPIPKLAMKQNEHVVPLILKLVPKLTDAMVAIEGTDQRTLDLKKLSEVLTTEGMRELATIIYWALERGHPDMTREWFDDNIVAGTTELVASVLVISAQTGLIRRGPAQPGQKPGEAKARTSRTGAQ